MAFTQALVLLACLVAAALTFSSFLEVPPANQEIAQVANTPIAITDVTVIDVVSGARRTESDGADSK